MRRRPQSKSPLKQSDMSRRATPQTAADLENSLDNYNGSKEASSVEPLLDTSYTEEVDDATRKNVFSPRLQPGKNRWLTGGFTLAFGLFLILLMATGKFDNGDCLCMVSDRRNYEWLVVNQPES